MKNGLLLRMIISGEIFFLISLYIVNILCWLYYNIMTSSETLRCKECGIIFNTVEDLYEHQKSEEEDKMLRHKGFSDG
jgi:hypothetical protein